MDDFALTAANENFQVTQDNQLEHSEPLNTSVERQKKSWTGKNMFLSSALEYVIWQRWHVCSHSCTFQLKLYVLKVLHSIMRVSSASGE